MEYSNERKNQMRTGFDSIGGEPRMSVGIGESEIVYMDLYPNQWDLVNHN